MFLKPQSNINLDYNVQVTTFLLEVLFNKVE